MICSVSLYEAECVLFVFSLDLNAAESGVQHKPSAPRNTISNDTTTTKEGCSC